MKNKALRSIAWLLVLLLLAGCTGQPLSALNGTEQVAANTPADTGAPYSVDAVDELTPEIIAVETATPVPTPEPTPEPTQTPAPLVLTCAQKVGTFTLTLQYDGRYEAAFADKTVRGTYTATDGVLSLSGEDGTSDTVAYTVDEQALTLLYPNQAALVLSVTDGTTGFLPAAADAPVWEETNPPATPDSDDAEASEPADQTEEPDQTGATDQTEPTDRAETDEPIDAGEPPVIGIAYVERAIVTVELKTGVAADYCFTCLDTPPADDVSDWIPVNAAAFRVFKIDGNYNLFVRDAQGRVSDPYPITVRSGYTYPIWAEGVTSLRTSLKKALEQHGTTVEAMNEAIWADAAAAGAYTREGIVTAAVSAVSHQGALGISVPYQAHGAYQGEHDWGMNPDWGSKLSEPVSQNGATYYYRGVQCVGAIVWAYKQAGINLSNEETGWVIGRNGEREKKNDNHVKFDRAKSGDLVQTGGHFLMIVDRVDSDGDGLADAYITYEMWAPYMALLQLTFRTVRSRTFYNMDAVFENEGRNRKHARFWTDTYHIPETAMPEAMAASIDASAGLRALDRLLRGLGLIDREDATAWR